MRIGTRAELAELTLLCAAGLLAMMVSASAQIPFNKIIDPLRLARSRDVPLIIFPVWPAPHNPPKPTPMQVPMEYQKRQLPPPEYDHDYDGDLLIIRKPIDELADICRSGLEIGQKALGCAARYPGPSCTIWIANDEDLKALGYDYDIVLRHELGHCSGWTHRCDGPTPLWMCRPNKP